MTRTERIVAAADEYRRARLALGAHWRPEEECDVAQWEELEDLGAAMREAKRALLLAAAGP